MSETHTVASWLGWFLTAGAVGAGWTLGCYVMGKACGAIERAVTR